MQAEVWLFRVESGCAHAVQYDNKNLTYIKKYPVTI